MKTIQKLVIIFILISSVLNAMEININKNYISELLNYKVKLPSYIPNPFIVKKVVTTPTSNKKGAVYIPKFENQRILLLAIFNNKALVKIEGLNVKKWVAQGDSIEDYKIIKIINNHSILVSTDKKTKIISLKENNINIKVTQ